MFLLEPELGSKTKEQGNIGNTHQCQCSDFQPMATYKESLCCQETKKFSRELFEEQKSIRKSSGFQIACLKKPILHASLSAVNHLRGDSMENLDIVHIDLQDTSNILFWCIIIFRKVFANSFHHASYRNTKRLRNMKSAI